MTPSTLATTCKAFALVSMIVVPCATVACAQSTDSPSVADRIVADVCDQQVVLLGELPSHGEAQAFQIKSQIVEGLVERCGFDQILFEAGLYDFLGFEEAMLERRATLLQLNRAIGRFWWTEGLTDWRQWLFEQAQADAVTLGGLDDQPSVTSDYARAVLPDLVASALLGEQAVVCRETIDRNLHWRYDDVYGFDESEQARLERCTRDAAEAAHGGLESSDTARSPQQRMLSSIASYYGRQLGGALDRDAVMHHTFRWHHARRPGPSKVVVWTATVHAAREQGELTTQPLGAYLAEEWGDELAAIGFTAAGGASSMAGMPSERFAEPPQSSLEALATADGGPLVYLDATALRNMGDVPSRLLGRFTSSDWSASFDGIVVVREETSPVFEAR